MTIARNAGLALLLVLLPRAAGAGSFEQTVPAQPGGMLHVRLDKGSIEVEAHDEPTVRVEARWTGSAELELRREDSDVELVGRAGWGLFGSPRLRVRVRIPERYSIDLETGGGSIEMQEVGGSVSARTSGGPIELEGARGRTELWTSGGSIEAYEVSGELVAHTSGGSIRVSEAAGPITVQTSGGSIQVHEVGGPVAARTSGGSISARFEAAPAGLLETSGGSIEAEIPEEAGVHLDAHTSGGRIEIDAPVERYGDSEAGTLIGDIHGGGPTLELRTSGGNILVRVR
jgi:hypothetical protein